ncbi:MAG: phosphoglycerate kinase [Patescibacteria group bacterium]
MELLQDVSLRGKKVFLRVDFNVPLEKGKILDNNRIKAAIPTIRFLAESRAIIIIGTHCGRPEGKPSPETSVALIAKELERVLNLKVLMAEGIVGENIKGVIDSLHPGQIIVLENLRWDPREEANDPAFAKELAGYADIYVNDAFAVSHRANSSVDAITKFLPSYAGLLMQSEITNLRLLLEKPVRPFVLIVGGIKVADKAAMIKRLAPLADKILVGGGVANTFLKARGQDIGKSVFDEEMIAECKTMLEKFGSKIVLPVDSVREDLGSGEFGIMDIGPETRKIFISEILNAKTVLWNGNLGKSEDEKYRDGMRDVAMAMAKIRQHTVVAGGDTAAFVIEEKLNNGIAFISTGGGAALEFLAGEKLPGIEALR